VTRPTHYSVQIAQRCQRLIDGLVDRVAADPALADDRGDPLRTTFLLAMSTPMLVLPIERLMWPAFRSRGGVADDTQLDEALCARMGDTLPEKRLFGATPFFERGAWAFVDAVPFFSVARDWPQEILEMLGGDDALRAAEEAPAATILNCLRNALAHGGITYLDRAGLQREEETNMVAFAAYPAPDRRKELRLLRISVDAYQRFLAAWTSWITDSGVQEALTVQGPGWLELASAE
jgi:hypothetical protein